MSTTRPGRLGALLLGAIGLLGATVAGRAAAANAPPADQLSALREGNRLYREGRLEEARQTYLAGYSPEEPHPVLAYNMATTSHHLGSLPEAILWYRRAAATNPGDPWMQENLSRARATLGLQPYPAPGLSGLLSRYSTPVSYLAALLAWIGVAWWIARPRRPAGVAFTLIAIGAIVFGAILLSARNAPRAAVVIEDCSAEEGDLPAGSEIWVTQEGDAHLQIVAGNVTLECPRDSVSLVSETG